MNARKLPSGRWQSKVYVGTVDGKKLFKTVTEDTRRECLLKAAQIQAEAEALKETPKLTVDDAVTKYIDAKRGVLSPATIAAYLAKQRKYITPLPIAARRVDQLSSRVLQEWVSQISPMGAKKTIKNAYGLLSASVRMFAPKADLSVTLPQGKRYEGYVPSTEEVRTVLRMAKEYDSRLYRACLLSAFATLRRGEIACLTADDIHGNMVHVEKDMVRNENKEWVVKLPKTEDSVRDVPLPAWVLNEMPKSGRLVDYNPEQITNYFVRIVKKAGVPRFRFHDLRKHAVSLMATQGVSMASIKEIGGWSNLQTPSQIYIKALSDAHKREMAQYLDHLDSLKI